MYLFMPFDVSFLFDKILSQTRFMPIKLLESAWGRIARECLIALNPPMYHYCTKSLNKLIIISFVTTYERLKS